MFFIQIKALLCGYILYWYWYNYTRGTRSNVGFPNVIVDLVYVDV